ncbi:protein dopey homolog PFC0245c-like [Leptopilina boulardi]|uniref:protein dopey homolog PFC0245c-like n=1 Tax=Leptopilina boulardi TaxID=63433 RepID=UPI0021F5DA16|nr:protein dopey homolog PFC0245c-like [Leptopilina boulardi]
MDLVTDINNIGTKFFFDNQNSMINFNVKSNLPIKDLFLFTSKFFIYIDCATNDTNIKRGIKYLYSHSSVVDNLKKYLKTPPKNQNTFQNLCYFFANIFPGGYDKCMQKLNNAYSCIQYQIPIQLSQEGTESYEILENMKKLFSKKWMNNVRILKSECKIKRNELKCDFNNKKLRSTKNQVKYIIENFFGHKIESESLSKITNQFSSVMSKNLVTKRIIRNCCDYIMIWRVGQKKLNILKKMFKKNPQVLKEYKKVSKSFYNYKNGVIEQLLNAIVVFNQIPLYLEKSLVKILSKQSNPTLFGSILMYLSRLIRAIFNRDSSYKFDVDYYENSNGLTVIQEEFPYFHQKMSTEDLFDNMLRTMSHLKNRDLSKKNSVFNGGLTNILLVLMFLETLSAVTYLISQNINISQPFPVENEEIPELDSNENDSDDNEDENIDDQEEIEDEETENEEEEEEEEEEIKEKIPLFQFGKRKKRFLYDFNFSNSSIFT